MPRPIIDDDAAVSQMCYCIGWVFDRNHENRRPLLALLCTTNLETRRLRSLDQQFGQILISFADARHRHFVDDFLAAQRRMNHVQCGRTQLETARVVAKLEMFDVESELVTRPKPSGNLWRELLDQC